MKHLNIIGSPKDPVREKDDFDKGIHGSLHHVAVGDVAKVLNTSWKKYKILWLDKGKNKNKQCNRTCYAFQTVAQKSTVL